MAHMLNQILIVAKSFSICRLGIAILVIILGLGLFLGFRKR